MSSPTMPTIAEFVASHPDADPKELLQVVMAETERLKLQAELSKEDNVARQQTWREETEVTLDENFNFRPKNLAQLQRLARMYAESGMVPDHYAVLNKDEWAKKVGACAIASQMALRCHVEIMTFLQSSYVVYGKPGIEGKLVTAILNCSGQINGRVDFELTKGPDGKITACRAFATDSKTGKELSQTVTWDMVVAEGWDQPKKGQKSKWVTLPDLMFAYRSATFLARVYFPDVLMGMHTIEELEDIGGQNGSAGSASVTTTGLEELSERLGAAPKPQAGAAGRGRPRKSAETKPAGQETTEPNNETDAAPTPANAPPTPSQASTDAKSPNNTTAKKQPVSTTAKSSNSSSSAAGTAAPVKSASQAETLALDELKDYIREQYPDDCENFDVGNLAKMALGQLEQREYVDSIMLRKNANWRRYAIAAPSSSTAPAGETQGNGDSADESQDSTPESAQSQDVPDFMVNKVARPRNFMMPGTHLERTIMGYRQAKRIRDLMTSQIKGHPDLEPGDSAYLMDLGERRSWQLEQGTPFEALAKETQIPA